MQSTWLHSRQNSSFVWAFPIGKKYRLSPRTGSNYNKTSGLKKPEKAHSIRFVGRNQRQIHRQRLSTTHTGPVSPAGAYLLSQCLRGRAAAPRPAHLSLLLSSGTRRAPREHRPVHHTGAGSRCVPRRRAVRTIRRPPAAARVWSLPGRSVASSPVSAAPRRGPRTPLPASARRYVTGAGQRSPAARS